MVQIPHHHGMPWCGYLPFHPETGRGFQAQAHLRQSAPERQPTDRIDFGVHGYLSGFIGSESLDMLSLQPASGGHWCFT